MIYFKKPYLINRPYYSILHGFHLLQQRIMISALQTGESVLMLCYFLLIFTQEPKRWAENLRLSVRITILLSFAVMFPFQPWELLKWSHHSRPCTQAHSIQTLFLSASTNDWILKFFTELLGPCPKSSVKNLRIHSFFICVLIFYNIAYMFRYRIGQDKELLSFSLSCTYYPSHWS